MCFWSYWAGWPGNRPQRELRFEATCPTPGLAEASSELKTGLASTGIANRGRSLAPVPAKLYVGHFGITLALVYLTRAMALMAEGRRC